MTYASITKQREASQKHYREHRQLYIEKARRNDIGKRDALRKVIRDAKNIPCQDCGITYPYYVMQFDHIGDDKDFSVANAINLKISVKRLVMEIQKCDVVCANCHAVRTHLRLEEKIEAPASAERQGEMSAETGDKLPVVK